ncbi:hypothetical protein DP49_5840 [Burkholderia pseudomallei]|nr:hypothetical protein DP49_5840 [Burkholderia pseudomallei]
MTRYVRCESSRWIASQRCCSVNWPLSGSFALRSTTPSHSPLPGSGPWPALSVISNCLSMASNQASVHGCALGACKTVVVAASQPTTARKAMTARIFSWSPSEKQWLRRSARRSNAFVAAAPLERRRRTRDDTRRHATTRDDTRRHATTRDDTRRHATTRDDTR